MSDARSCDRQTLFILSPHNADMIDAASTRDGPRYIGGQMLPARGGLSGWQRRKVADFIEAHVGETLPLLLLAGLANLSPYHFARSFKRSFGLPPHRYHAARRIARAKTMLAEPSRSVTEIGRTLGFAETSSFSTAFRKATGVSPSDYRRGLG